MHKQFDEATAILAGDGLLTMAFEVLSNEQPIPTPRCAPGWCMPLAVAAGWRHGRRADDRSAAEKMDLDIGAITRLQRDEDRRHHRLFLRGRRHSGSCLAAPAHVLISYAQTWASPSRSSDDPLDAEGSAETGKPVGADAKAGKRRLRFYPGLGRARAQARILGDQANAHLDSFGPKADPLRWMTDFVISRKS